MGSYLSLLERSFPLLLKGMQMTFAVFVCGGTISFTVGCILGVFSAERLKMPLISPLIDFFTFCCRAIPFYVQLLIVYFVLPDLLGYNLEPFSAAVTALGICSSGYVAQIVRAGINSIPRIQWEAALVLGYSRFQTLRSIILPQMLRNILPAFNNELDALLKSTAIVSSIGLLELTRAGMNLVSREMEPVPIYLMVALFYLSMSAILNAITRVMERKLAYVKN